MENELASQCDRVIRAAAESLSRSSLRIGWYGHILRKNKLFGELGFDSEEAYYRDCGIGRSTWYRAVAIAERLEHLGREKVLAMNVENARILARVPENHEDFAWLVDVAETKPTKEFARVVSMSGVETGAVNARYVELAIPVSAEDKKRILASLRRWKSEYGLSSIGEALRDMCEIAQSKTDKIA